MGVARIATCPLCGDLFPIEVGISYTCKDGTPFLCCGPDCACDAWHADQPARAEEEPEGKGGEPWN